MAVSTITNTAKNAATTVTTVTSRRMGILSLNLSKKWRSTEPRARKKDKISQIAEKDVFTPASFRHADWALPLTFIMFFVFIGNMKRVPEFAGIAQAFVGQHPLEVSIISSQIISNVPASLLLSGFCDQWVPLIIGTNIGGMGTLIASMASLITALRNSWAWRPNTS